MLPKRAQYRQRSGPTGTDYASFFNMKAAELHGYSTVPEAGRFQLQDAHIPVLL